MSGPAHFSLEEFLVSDTARSLGVSNYPTWDIVDNLRRLGDTMERIRAGLGGHPITITSGYRSPPVNNAVGGATNSAHLSGLACDFVVPHFRGPPDVCAAIQPYLVVLEIDQLIDEGGGDGWGWVHLGLCDPPEAARCECFRLG